MKQLGKLRRLPATQRRELLRALVLLWAVRLGLWMLPFDTLRRLLAAEQVVPRPDRPAEPTERRVAWAVLAASRYVPRPTCLAQALAAQALLRRQGLPSQLRIGVARQEDGLEAHAWLESQGRVVIGGGDLSRYVPLPRLERSGRP
jgi:hypothetical protein